MLQLSTSLCALAASSLLVVGCTVASDEDISEDLGTTAQTVSTECSTIDADTCDPTQTTTSNPVAFTFTLLTDSAGFYLTGTNDKGQTLTAAKAHFASTTVFRSAQLNQYPVDPIYPTDPITPQDLAAAYNSGLGDSTVFTTIGLMPAYGIKARVWLDKRTNTIRAFRPVY